jgi:hypothetical protein
MDRVDVCGLTGKLPVWIQSSNRTFAKYRSAVRETLADLAP